MLCVSVRTDDLQSVRQKLSADMADHSGNIRDITHAQNFSIPTVRMRIATKFLQCARAQFLCFRSAHAHIFSISTVQCTQIFYFYSEHAQNFSIPAVRMRRTSLFLQCACAQLLYSCSAHAHNFSFL
jgi:hypothetical protein